LRTSFITVASSPTLVSAAHPLTGKPVAKAQVTIEHVAELVGVSVRSFEAMFDRAVDVFGWNRDAWDSWNSYATRDLMALWDRIGDPSGSVPTSETAETGE
jgi:hypothetical protein